MEQPIGIFDSGVGGLSVWLELQKQLPNENYVYFADSKNCPYGSKTENVIAQLATAITQFLINKHCKLIIVACNTATAAAIQQLRSQFKVPFVGMEPAIKPAALNTKTGVIGILATEGTFKGNHYKETSAKFASNIGTITQAGIGLVELVENNKTQSDEAIELLKKYINPMLNKNADKIVLGCTHYPFFNDSLNKIIPPSVEIINPAPAIALRTQQLLQENKLFNLQTKKGVSMFYSSGNTEVLQQLLNTYTEEPIKANKIEL